MSIYFIMSFVEIPATFSYEPGRLVYCKLRVCEITMKSTWNKTVVRLHNLM